MRRPSRWNGCLRRWTAWFAVVVLWTPLLKARPKTDVIFFTNGDRLTCEIRSFSRGKVEVKTHGLGTIKIEWDRIERIDSGYFFEVELQSGLKLYGSLGHLAEEKKMVVTGMSESVSVEYPSVVRLAPIDQSFWERLKGSIDIGYDFTQAESATEWSTNANANYRTEKYRASADFSSRFRKQEGAENVLRNSLNLSLTRSLGKKWFGLGFTRLLQNDSQELNLRGFVGGGIGRHVIQTNHMLLGIVGGAGMSREQFTGQDFTTGAEALGGVQFEAFRFKFPELDSTTLFLVFPSLSPVGRVRLELDSRLRVEILKDLYWGVNLYNSFDSDPPTATARKNDFGIGTSLGWSF